MTEAADLGVERSKTSPQTTQDRALSYVKSGIDSTALPSVRNKGLCLALRKKSSSKVRDVRGVEAGQVLSPWPRRPSQPVGLHRRVAPEFCVVSADESFAIFQTQSLRQGAASSAFAVSV